jgi:hypothetical protein
MATTLSELCSTVNPSWRGKYADAYHYKDATGTKKTVFRYQIPMDAQDESLFLAKYLLSPKDRKSYYKNLAISVQRQVAILDRLHREGVQSILKYSRIEQERMENGVTAIYLETEEVYPIKEKLFSPSVSALTAVDVFLRIAYVFRDISKCGVVHRGFDMDEVYINAENKILVGGFYYAACPGAPEFTEFLPQAPVNRPWIVDDGFAGNQGTDIQALCMAAWNVFSGLPAEANRFQATRLVQPEYATEQITEALLFGLKCSEMDGNAFRRKLLDARKAANKTNYAQLELPFAKPLLAEWVLENGEPQTEEGL